MILICRPIGRGNWTPMVMRAPGLLLAKVGDRFPLFGVTWRVAEVRA